MHAPNISTTFIMLVVAFTLSCSTEFAFSAAPDNAAPVKPWAKMKRAERKEYMKHTVLPKMKETFSAFDTHYDDMKCVTCHGKGAKNDTYKMPNPGLPKLPASADGFKTLEAKKPEMVKFMRSKVMPGMAALLGEKPRDQQNPKGFGCFDCHTKK